MKCVWLPGPPPPPGSVSLAVAKLGRGPFAWAAGVVVESLQALSTATSTSAADQLVKRSVIVTSFEVVLIPSNGPEDARRRSSSSQVFTVARPAPRPCRPRSLSLSPPCGEGNEGQEHKWGKD